MNRAERRGVIGVALAFLVLLAMSAYRRDTLTRFPADPVLPYVTYATYVLLVSVWLASIRLRVTQQSMRRFIMAEGMLMFCGVTVRFVQDTVLSGDILLKRESGYLLMIPLVLLPLLGWYAALGLGQPDDYRTDPRWLSLAIPALILVALILTDGHHHLIFEPPASDAKPDLLFHPNVGAYLIAAWYTLFILLRLAWMIACSRRLGAPHRGEVLPFVVSACMFAVTIPYFSISVAPVLDLVEFFARIFFAEAMVWESCAVAGIAPVNTGYEDVLHRSTIALQIFDEDGNRYIGSADAPTILKHELAYLIRHGTMDTDDGCELHSKRIKGGWCVWQEDHSAIKAAAGELGRKNEALTQRGALLAQELRARSNEERVRSQSAIYDMVAREVGVQLEQLNDLLHRVELLYAGDPPEGPCSDREALLLDEIRDLGSLVKRHCMARLVELGEVGAGEGG